MDKNETVTQPLIFSYAPINITSLELKKKTLKVITENEIPNPVQNSEITSCAKIKYNYITNEK